MAAKKKPATTVSAPTSQALKFGAEAAGARYVQPGFAFTAEQDLAFALGWPYMYFLVDGHPDHSRPHFFRHIFDCNRTFSA